MYVVRAPTVVKGLTTYDYIVLQRRLKKEKKEEEAEEQQEQGVVEADRHGRCWFLRRKVYMYKLIWAPVGHRHSFGPAKGCPDYQGVLISGVS